RNMLIQMCCFLYLCFFFFQAEDGIRDRNVTGVQTCALPILAMRIILRFNDGARVIQFASGCMPIISECACWEIWRTKVLRYPAGIQSRGSMRESAAMISSKRC